MRRRYIIAAHVALVLSALAPAQTMTSSLSAPLSREDFDAALTTAAATNLEAMRQTTPQFVANSAYLTRATLKSDYPCNNAQLGKYAHVGDAWQSVSTTFVCEANGTFFYWRPQRTDYATTIAQASGTITLQPLVTAPTVYLSTTPTSPVTINLSDVDAWPGASFRIYAPATISLNGVNINGLVGGGTLPLLQGTDKVVTYTCVNGTSSCVWKGN